MRRLFVYILLGVLAQQAGAQVAGGYYNTANGKTGAELKTALAKVINPHDQLKYTSETWPAIEKLDKRSDGKILDRYSNTTNFTPVLDRAGNYSGEGDVYNHEHSFPSSRFNDEYPMRSDIMHLIATDGYVNNRRSSYPFGETKNPSYTSDNGYSKLGPCSVEGYSKTVFEPNDEWKGDFARIYFYMVTCYEDDITGWNYDMLDGKTYPGLSDWALKMLLRWAKNDPVSEVEKARNNGVQKIQGNRNPFVDFEGLEQFVWGQFTDSVPDLNNYKSIYSLIEGDGGTVSPGGETPGGDDPTPGDYTDNYSETWDSFTDKGGNDNAWSDVTTDLIKNNTDGWVYDNVYTGYECIRVGSAKKPGSATTPAINVNKDGTYILTFRAGAWNSSKEKTELKITLSGGTFENGATTTTEKLQKGAFGTFTLTIKATGNTLKITFESGASSNSRFFLDDVVVKSSSATGIKRIEQSAGGGPSARRVDRSATLRNGHYDLMGRPVDKTIRGIVIHRGKKVLKR